jgi:hypothetical protein
VSPREATLPLGPEASRLAEEAESAGQSPEAALSVALEAGAGALRRVTDRGTGEAVERALSLVPETVREAVRRSVLEAAEVAPSHAVEHQRWLGGWLQALNSSQAEAAERLGELAEGLRSAQERRELLEKSASKGRPFERALFAACEEFARRHGDAVLDVSTDAGLGGSKVGDLVVELADGPRPQRRLAVEAKATSLSLPKALATLDEALRAREANAAVLVFSKQEEAPTQGLPLRYYGGGRVVCVYDQEEGPLALEAALGLARGLAASESGDPGSAADQARVADAARRLTEALEDGRAVGRALAAARRGLDSADEAYSRLRDRALAVVNDLS